MKTAFILSVLGVWPMARDLCVWVCGTCAASGSRRVLGPFSTLDPNRLRVQMVGSGSKLILLQKVDYSS